MHSTSIITRAIILHGLESQRDRTAASQLNTPGSLFAQAVMHIIFLYDRPACSWQITEGLYWLFHCISRPLPPGGQRHVLFLITMPSTVRISRWTFPHGENLVILARFVHSQHRRVTDGRTVGIAMAIRRWSTSQLSRGALKTTVTKRS